MDLTARHIAYDKPLLHGLTERQILLILNRDIQVGDIITMGKGGQQDTGLYLGEIIGIDEHGYQIKTLATNRTTTRGHWQVHKVTTDLVDFKAKNPELFI